MFSVHVIMMFMVRDDSFQNYLLLEINACYINILTLKCPQIQSQSIYFSKFSWGGMPPDPPSSILCMLIVLRTIPGSPSLSYALLSGI